MFIGHYGAAMAAKKFAPKLNLGVLILAAQFLDTLWPVLLLSGLEQVEVAPGTTVVNPLRFTHYPYSHSLAFTLLWALLFAGLARFAFKRGVRESLLLGGLVLSHWILDLPFHEPDLPVLPSGPFLGGGLWNSLPVTLACEFGLFLGGAWVYWKSTQPHPRPKAWLGLLALLALIYLGAVFGPPPPADVKAIGASGLGLALIVLGWAGWVDRRGSSKKT